MKSRLLFTLACCLSPVLVHAQCEGRYIYEQFSSVNETPDILYGGAADFEGNFTDLYVDFYEPAGDTMSERPLVILAHGGFFVTGDRKAEDMIALCQGLAKRGYVAASMQYRLGVGTDEIDSIGFSKAVVRGVQDAKAAVRFFRANAALYGIDTNQIFLGGTSAGGVLAVHYAYLQDTADSEPWINSVIADLGGLAGNSGNPGYGTSIIGASSYAGAIKNVAWMGANDIPLFSTHGTGDPVVPYAYGLVTYILIPGVIEVPITPMFGSQRIHEELDARGVDNDFISVDAEVHVPHIAADYSGLDSVLFPLTLQRTAEFFHRQLDCYVFSGLGGPQVQPLVVRPLPAEDHVFLDALPLGSWTLTLWDAQGRAVEQRQISGGNTAQIARNGLPAGLYLLEAADGRGQLYRGRLVFR